MTRAHPSQSDTTEIRDRDRTPGRISVWVCQYCGYWRRRRETGYHVDYQGRGPGQRHGLVEAFYIYEGPGAIQ